MTAKQSALYVFAHLDGGFVLAGRLALTEEADQVLASRFA